MRLDQLKGAGFLIAALLCVVILSAPALANQPSEKQDVKIGVIIPLTGGLAARGEDVTRFIKILEPHLNQHSVKYQFRFIIDDGKCGAGNAPTTIVKKLISVDKVKFLITGCSGETLQAGPIAQRNGVLTIAVLSTHQDVKKIGDYVFRTFVDIERGVEKFTDYIGKKSGGRIAILTEENAFTFGIQTLLIKYLDTQVVYSDDYPEGTSDFKTLLLKIKSKNPGGIYFNTMSENTLITLVNQTRALGIKQPLYTYNMPEARSFREATGKNSEGMEYIGSPSIENSSDEFNQLLKEFLKRHPEGPSYEFVLRTFFDGSKSIVDAIEAVGPDAKLSRDYLNTYKSLGALGVVEYDANGDIKNINYFLRRIENGQDVVVEDLMKIDLES